MEAEIPFFVVCACFCWDFSWGFFSVLKSETLYVGVLYGLCAGWFKCSYSLCRKRRHPLPCCLQRALWDIIFLFFPWKITFFCILFNRYDARVCTGLTGCLQYVGEKSCLNSYILVVSSQLPTKVCILELQRGSALDLGAILWHCSS